MSEIMTPPIITRDRNGNDVASFTSDHSLADIARWIMRNKGDAEELHAIIGQMLAGNYGETIH